MNNILLKEASAVITDLLTALDAAKTESNRLRGEVQALQSTVRREKLADELERKSFLPYDELKKIKDNRYSEAELDNFEKLSELDPSFVTERFPVTDYQEMDVSLLKSDADTRRAARSEFLRQSLQNY